MNLWTDHWKDHGGWSLRWTAGNKSREVYAWNHW